MEIDVTHMVEDADRMVELSGSRMEHGQDAGRITWNNAKEYGAWSDEEIAAWSEEDLQAITCQDVAAAVREMEVADSHEEYERLCEEGTCSGRLYRGDDSRWYFYLGM